MNWLHRIGGPEGAEGLEDKTRSQALHVAEEKKKSQSGTVRLLISLLALNTVDKKRKSSKQVLSHTL